MPEARTQSRGFVEESRSIKSDWLYRSNPAGFWPSIVTRCIHGKCWKKVSRPQLLSQEKDLALILQEVGEITKALKSSAPDTQALGEALHRSVICAVKRSLLEREFRSLALMDDLTNLYNRRAFFALAAQQIKVMRRKAQGLLVFFAVVDHLKNINDTYGHREGDLAPGSAPRTRWNGRFAIRISWLD